MAFRSLLVLLSTLAIALSGCGGSETEVQAPTLGATGADGSGLDISGTGLDGEALSVADFAGKPLFVNVWSSW